MSTVLGYLLGLILGLALGLITACVAAIPIMWLAAFLHTNGMPIVHPFSYGQSFVIALLLTWTAVFTQPSGSSS